MFARPTSQSVRPADAQPHGEQREGVDQVDTQVDQTLEHHHHQPQLETHQNNTSTQKTTDSNNHTRASWIKHRLIQEEICFTHQSKDQIIQRGRGQQKQQDGEEQSPEKQLHHLKKKKRIKDKRYVNQNTDMQK